MTQLASRISKAVAIMDGWLLRKLKPPAPRAHAHANMEDMLTWPWLPLHDAQAEPFGPLTAHAKAGTAGNWQMTTEASGLRIYGNTNPDNAVTLGGKLPHPLRGVRLTAAIDIHRLEGEDALAALVFAATDDARAVMALNGTGDLVIFTLRGGQTEILHHTPMPPPAPGQRAGLVLLAMLFGDEAVLFANGTFAGSMKSPDLIGPSRSAGFQVKAGADVTLRAFTADGIDPSLRA